MYILLAIIAVILIIAAAAYSLSKKIKEDEQVVGKKAVEYVAVNPLTPTEIKFFHLLQEAIPGSLIVPQMAMAALVDISDKQKAGKDGRQLHLLRSGISQKRLDFVVLNQQTMQVVCVIELDDHTHDGAKRKAADKSRDAMLETAGYIVRRFDARQWPTATDVRAKLGLKPLAA